MDLNIIKSVLDADDDANSSLVALASQVCSGLEVFANIPDGIRYSIAKELVTFEEALSPPRQALSPPRLEDSEQVDIITVKRRRTHYEKGTVEDSNWYRRYLATPHHIADVKNPRHPKGIEFRRNFSVPYQVYETLLQMTLENGWYDANRKNAIGVKCSDCRLLLLGVLHTLTDNASKYACQTNTNISAESHRRFNTQWWTNMVSIRSEYIGMPETENDLATVAADFDKNGLPGCCGSMDVVHRGWDKCPSEMTPLFKGKEGFPTVAFQVIVSHRKKILHVSMGYPGARNDKQIVKVDSAPKSLHSGNHWLRSRKWYSKKHDGSVVQQQGYWLLVDGGYLRWPSLICPIRYDTSTKVRRLAKHLESVRKDVECCFGALKKRFKCLKVWSELHSLGDIDNQFVVCCMLHNILLKYDGYEDEDYEPDVHRRGKPQGTFLPAYDATETGIAVSSAEESAWVERIKDIADHFDIVREK